jgi:hypothetical protein
MKKLLPSLALGIIAASSASAAVLLDETFNYGLSDGATLLDAANNTPSLNGGWYKTFSSTFNYESTSLDATGGAGFLDLGSAARVHTAVANQTAGEVTTFSFLLNIVNAAGTNLRQGSRVIFEGAGTSSNYGYGINMDTTATGVTTSYARVGTGAGTSVSFSGTVKVEGTFTRTGQFAGNLSVNYYNGVGFSTLIGTTVLNGGSWLNPALATPTPVSPTSALVVRNTSGDLNMTIDNIIFSDSSPVPEPSSFAALAGLGALGFAASRRRRRA